MNETINNKDALKKKVSKEKTRTKKLYDDYKNLLFFMRKASKDKVAIKRLFKDKKDNFLLSKEEVKSCIKELKQDEDTILRNWVLLNYHRLGVKTWQFLVGNYIASIDYKENEEGEAWDRLSIYYKFLYEHSNDDKKINSVLDLFNVLRKEENFNYLFENKK